MSLTKASDYVRQKFGKISFNSGSWVVLSTIELQIKNKIENIGKPLKDWDIQINYGIKTGFNEAFIINSAKRDELIGKCPKSEEIIRPILRGRDIKKYKADWAGLYIINTHTGYKSQSGQIIPAVNIEEYPAIKDHLDKFYTQLSVRQDKGMTPYHLRSCIYMEDFYKQKIVWGNLNLSASYCLAEEGMFINAPCAIITPYSAYLLAILNSRIADYYIRNLGVTRNGGYFEYKPMFVEKLPLPILSDNEREALSKLVENPTIQNQYEINLLIYKIYGLSASEISFVESLFN
ncbi:TaqI-like C-terminal specificity domain-containing protein [Flavobacterium sp. DGU11]|uniref:site-specific DNA-methyltransferase (adenine-specific) n=1 Tax=Flavobacterium arundinis TaxID=3139143 RepID=A0ABU9HZT8_9FLAO